MTILVTAASGALGQAIAEELRAHGARAVLGAREPAKLGDRFETRRVDYDDPSSLRDAFADVRTLLVISSNAPNEARLRQHAAAIDAAREAGVGRIVYTSFVGAQTPGDNPLLEVHHDAERRLRESGVPWVALRNGLYLDSLPALLGPFRETGVVAHPAGDAPASWITRRDIAAFTVDVLLDETTQNVALNLVTEEARSFSSAIDAVSQKTGVAIEYREPSDDEYRGMLRRAGFDEGTVAIFVQVCRAMREGALGVDESSFHARLGRPAESVDAFLDRVLAV